MQSRLPHSSRSGAKRRGGAQAPVGLIAALAAPGILALILDPARWLWRTWHDPSYQSDGMVVAIVTAALLIASVVSGPAPRDVADRRRALSLLALTAAVRLLGRVLAVNTLGALALVVDVAAIAILFGVTRRPFALHPGVLAAFSALALPLEHLAQRLLGHPLQLVAATVSEWLLRGFFPLLEREGVLLVHPDVALAVDLPCSGARGLTLYCAIALGLWTRRAPRIRGLCEGVAAVAFGAFAANVLRIVCLFVAGMSGIPVIDEPWHSLLGASTLAVCSLPLLAVAARQPGRRPTRPTLGRRIGIRGRETRPLPWPAALISSVGVSVVGIAIAAAPQHPVDTTAPISDRRLPVTLGAFAGTDVPLREVERRYYDAWGGFAQKRVYDDGFGLPHTALLVRTRSPLRHLHGPDRCLLGAGHRVTRLGVTPGATPAVVYRSVAPNGTPWRVEASFVSDSGRVATSVSEVVWRWLEDPDTTWSLIERISPWSSCETSPRRCRDFQGALFASLDLPLTTEDLPN